MLMQNNTILGLFRSALLPLILALVSLSWATPALSKPERIETKIGEVDVRLTGRFMYDVLPYSSLNSRDETSVDWRRARLGLSAAYTKDWRFRISTNFPDGNSELHDLRVDYRGWPVRLSVGRMQEPFGLSASASSNHSVLMERSLAGVLGPGYSSGIMANTRSKEWSLTVGLFDQDIAGIELTDSDSNNDQSLGARATWKAINNDEMLMHLGASLSLRDPDGNRGVRLSASPESRLVSGLNISHPRIADADDYTLFGAEFALQQEQGLLQAEYLSADIDSAVGNENFMAITCREAGY